MATVGLIEKNIPDGGILQENRGTKRLAEESTDHSEKRHETQKPSKIDPAEGEERALMKLKKIVLLISYLGKGYLGMQRNPGCKTIEEDLLKALHEASVIPHSGYQTAQIIHFQRAARTDKGVSAARQIVSLKMCVEEDGIVDKVNSFLPLQIRVLALKRVTKKFDSKYQCDARTYSYLLPSVAFCSLPEVTQEDYRMSAELHDEVNDVLALFKGTHNFHNFTARRKADDPSSHRYIMDMVCSEPFARQGVEFVIIKVKGQSFMLHQIRKMLGLAIAIVRGLASRETLHKAWTTHLHVDIPIAPSLGLVLEEVHYERYNQRFGKDGVHEAILWDSNEEAVESFKEEYINSDIIRTEIEENSMLKWVFTLNLHTFDIREDRPLPQNSVSGDQNPSVNGLKDDGIIMERPLRVPPIETSDSCQKSKEEHCDVTLAVNVDDSDR